MKEEKTTHAHRIKTHTLSDLMRFLIAFLFFPLVLPAADKPNIIYLMLDEWGYFESGHMGHPELLTPNIDKVAREGIRFTNAYAGAPVCGPTRCVLLTGLHSGHTSIRTNNGSAPIREDEPTLASMLKSQGYATGGFGKWGIGGRGTSGVPEKHGFDLFFGYYDQVHAHTYYPQYLIRNRRFPSRQFWKVTTKGKPMLRTKSSRNHSLSSARIMKPVFCYLPGPHPRALGNR